MKTRYHLLYLFLITPNLLFAHGEQVFKTFIIDVLVFLVLLIFIALLRWNTLGKLVLLGILILTEFLLHYGLNFLPYDKHKTLINGLSFTLPIAVFIGTSQVLKGKFRRN